MLKVASFFSGAGGLDYGFHKTGFEVVFANDFFPEACETYKHNFGQGTLVEGDLWSLLDSVPDHDILLGGFPCQSYSLAGLRKGLEDPRGQMIFAVVKNLQRVKPKYFFLENVRGIVSHESFEAILTFLKEVGYNVSARSLDLSKYGVPQKRHRVLFVGVREDLAISPDVFFPQEVIQGAILRDVLQGIRVPFGEENHNLHVSTKVKQHWFSVLREGENLAKLSEDEIRRRETELGLEHKPIPKTFMGYRRLDGSKIAPTMVFGNTCLPIHPTENRNLSVRECATIQGFPKDFLFKGSISSQYKQVGNAVPPLFSFLLARHIKSVLE